MSRQLLRATQIISIIGLFLSLTAPTVLANSGVLRIYSGSVSIKRSWWLFFSATYDGVQLGGRDQIRAAGGSNAELHCPGTGSTVPVPVGITRSVNSLCNTAAPIYRPYQTLIFGDLGGGSEPNLPYVITPRAGAVLEATPTIRWNPVAGAARYTVRLEARRRRNQAEPEAVLWEVETTDTELDYPPDVSPLESRVFYTVVVKTDTGQTSAAEPVERRPSFRLSAEPELAGQLAEIETLGLPPDVETVRKAILYMEADLYTAAIQTLQNTAEQNTSVRILRALGNAYLAAGLRLLAEEAYLDALVAAQFYQDLEDWTMTQVALGELYQRTGQLEKAIQRLRQAQVAAFYVCDRELMEQVQGLLNELTGEEQVIQSCKPEDI
jgi:hypothetical protein